MSRGTCTGCNDVIQRINDQIGCGTYTAPIGYVSSCSNVSVGAVCQLSCDGDNGYSGSPSSISCGGDYLWTAAYGCSNASITCDNYVPQIGYTNAQCNGNASGSSCSLDCATGWAGNASNTTCETDGTWSNPTGCSLVMCPAYTAPVGYVNATCSGIFYGDVCDLECSMDYSGTPTQVTCLSTGVWSSVSGCTPGDGTSSASTLSTCVSMLICVILMLLF